MDSMLTVQKPHPPSGIFTLVTIQVLLGALGLAAGGRMLLTASGSDAIGLEIIGLELTLAGFIYLVLGTGTYQGKSWAWNYGMLMSIITLVSILV
ncbi:hypothetical protein J2P12_02220, partial [Candidatus Bathyarchaeota archaeon]|nr:hypothetical protein [Candidatus Bathyarchaeota archaeon]